MALKYVWFDLGYTLVYMKREECFYNMLSKMGKNVQLQDIVIAYHIIDKLFMREYKGLLCESRETFMPVYFEKLLGFLQLDIDINTALQAFYSEEKILLLKNERLWFAYEGVIDVFSMLKLNYLKIGLITNWDTTARDVLKQNKLESLLDKIIISSEVGFVKPEKQIFELALDREDAKPEECLYVGDNYYDDTVGSRSAGMNSVLVNPYGRLGMEELDDVDIISNVRDLPQYIKNKFNSLREDIL